jgi:hypothetical protein
MFLLRRLEGEEWRGRESETGPKVLREGLRRKGPWCLGIYVMEDNRRGESDQWNSEIIG